ncbi:MAG: HD domain-containing protein [Lachnospiraceae bacterium]|nr:HD domain-containing protein [Lachnospiraceae bacterium]
MQFEEMERKLKSKIKKSRYIHTQGVIAAARHLAQIHHYNEEKAAIAALLHDCAKYMPEEERVAYCESHGVDVNDAERTNLTLLHAKCGAVMAEEEFGIENQEILHAIRVHTTGEPEMNLLDKIIFVADYIEPNRTHAPNLEMLRALAETDLDRTTAVILSDTLDYLKKNGRTIDDTTQEAYDYYKQYL